MVGAPEASKAPPGASESPERPARTRGWHLRKDALGLLILLLATVFSRAAFVWYESLHFDSDQAVVGLMGLDLARARGFTVYYYGLGYLATVEPYLAAPLFLLFGPSRWALKLPLLLMGVAVAWMMYIAFRRDTGTPRQVPLPGSAASPYNWSVRCSDSVPLRCPALTSGAIRRVFYGGTSIRNLPKRNGMARARQAGRTTFSNHRSDA